MDKRKILLTGASGSMGSATFLELLKRRDEYDLVLLLRPSEKKKNDFAKYVRGNTSTSNRKTVIEYQGIKIVWGDLTNPKDVFMAVNGCDFVLHPAALISPAADHNPELTMRARASANPIKTSIFYPVFLNLLWGGL